MACSGGGATSVSRGAEGTVPADCTDGADNDGDGLFDCDDPGCAGAPACAATTSPADGGRGDAKDGPLTEPGGPRFLSFGINQPKLSRGQGTVIVSAVLTDPDGVEDIVGGQLFHEGSNAVYGSFATSAQEGAYSITLSWNQLTPPAKLPAFGDDLALGLRAEFFDQAGHRASQTFAVTLSCTDPAAREFGQVTPTGCALAHCAETRTVYPEGLTTAADLCLRCFNKACTGCDFHDDPAVCSKVLPKLNSSTTTCVCAE